MAAKGNSGREDGFDLRQNFASTLGLHKFRAGGDKAVGVRHRVLNRLVTFERQIAAEQRIRLRAGSGANVMLHFRHRHMGRVRIAEHDHANGIADEQQRHTRLIEQFCHRKIIRRERGDLLAATLHRANLLSGDLGRTH